MLICQLFNLLKSSESSDDDLATELTLQCNALNNPKSFSSHHTSAFFSQIEHNIHEYRRTRLQPLTDWCTITNIILPTWQTRLLLSLCGGHLLCCSSKRSPQEGYELRNSEDPEQSIFPSCSQSYSAILRWVWLA